jgi:hypothetical protein
MFKHSSLYHIFGVIVALWIANLLPFIGYDVMTPVWWVVMVMVIGQGVLMRMAGMWMVRERNR